MEKLVLEVVGRGRKGRCARITLIIISQNCDGRPGAGGEMLQQLRYPVVMSLNPSAVRKCAAVVAAPPTSYEGI